MKEPTTIDDLVRRAVERRPDQPALADAPNRETVDGNAPQRLTWAELDGRIDGAAAALAAHGIGPGDPVGIQLANVVELPITILACFRLGAVAVPFPIQHRAHELRDGVATAGLDVFVTADRPDRPDQIATATTVLGERGPTTVLTPERATGRPITEQAIGRDARATICWTSGTTGTPKGVPRTHAQWMASSSFQVSELRITPEDHILCPFPVVNMAGIGGMLVPWSEAGAFLALHHPLDLQVFLGQLQSEQISYTVVPPAALNMLLGNEALLDSLDLSHIRAISSGSAPLDPWMVQGWQARGIEIVNVFGSNEGAAMLSTMAAVPDPTERARYFPVPDRPGVEVKLVDLADEVEAERVAHVLRDVLEVLLVLLGQDHPLDPGRLGRDHLLLDAADRQDLAAQRDLAGHREIGRHRDAGQERDHGGRERHARRRPILRNRAGRDVDVEVAGLEQVLVDPETRGVRADPRVEPQEAGRASVDVCRSGGLRKSRRG